jgi:predicted TIM-barrel fold metal-dependent hydrolase
MVPLLDTHQHLVYPDRQRYAWMAGAPALDGRRFGIDDYQALTAGAGVASGILGIIAACRPETNEGFEAWLEEGPAIGVVGYRRILHETTDDVSQGETFRANVGKIGARGLTFDMCFQARQLPIALDLVRACDGTAFVLDHCGVPDIAGGGLDPWRQYVRDLAAMPNVVAKLSGVFAYTAEGDATLSAVRPYVSHVIDCFGPDRCLWGSDWPVVNVRGGDLPGWIAAFRTILAGFSEEEQHAMAHRTAERVYRVTLPG